MIIIQKSQSLSIKMKILNWRTSHEQCHYLELLSPEFLRPQKSPIHLKTSMKEKIFKHGYFKYTQASNQGTSSNPYWVMGVTFIEMICNDKSASQVCHVYAILRNVVGKLDGLYLQVTSEKRGPYANSRSRPI